MPRARTLKPEDKPMASQKTITTNLLDLLSPLLRHRMQQESWVDPEAAIDRAYSRALQRVYERQQAAQSPEPPLPKPAPSPADNDLADRS
jgi:hypothetical protein